MCCPLALLAGQNISTVHPKTCFQVPKPLNPKPASKHARGLKCLDPRRVVSAHITNTGSKKKKSKQSKKKLVNK